MNAFFAYQFEEEPVRAVLVGDDPWFVANDVAKVLGYALATNMTRMLDDDEKGIHIVNTLGGQQELIVISESGLYAAILKSRREEARRFRKWVTSEVLPALRREGRYAINGAGDPPPPMASELDPPRLMAGVAVVREARRLFGPASARAMWMQVGLPAPIAEAVAHDHSDPFAAPLKDWLSDKEAVTGQEAARGIGLKGEIDFGTVQRIAALLRLFGWIRRKERREHGTANVWRRPLPLRGEA